MANLIFHTGRQGLHLDSVAVGKGASHSSGEGTVTGKGAWIDALGQIHMSLSLLSQKEVGDEHRYKHN